jgi:hypothetical protein
MNAYDTLDHLVSPTSSDMHLDLHPLLINVLGESAFGVILRLHVALCRADGQTLGDT